MTELDLPEADTSELDEDDRLKPEFVRAVCEAVDRGDDEAARELVEPLHPADLADLFELVPGEQRAALATELGRRHVANALAAKGAPVSGSDTRSGGEWLLVPGVTPQHLGIDGDAAMLGELIEDARYAPYLERQAAELAAAKVDHVELPRDFTYGAVPGLSNEMVERLTLAVPETLAAAGRIQGVTPAALVAILLHHRGGKLAA